jgi:hypothetical protein
MSPAIPAQMLSSSRLHTFTNCMEIIPSTKVTAVNVEHALIMCKESSSALYP